MCGLTGTKLSLNLKLRYGIAQEIIRICRKIVHTVQLCMLTSLASKYHFMYTCVFVCLFVCVCAGECL